MSCLQSWNTVCSRLVDHKTSVQPERESKVLVIGLPGSGKSTLIKQMRAAQTSRFCFSESEVASFKTMIFTSLILSAKTIVQHPIMQLENAAQWDIILNYVVPQSLNLMPSDLVEAIRRLLLIPAINMMILTNELGLSDSAIYFLTQFVRICDPNYQILISDILRVPNQINGLAETKIAIDSYPPVRAILCEYGPILTDCYKWLDQFERAVAFVFCVGLDKYDSQEHLTKAMELFRRIVNLKFPPGASIAFILVFTKEDVMKTKLQKTPFNRVFADYKDKNQVKNAVHYLGTKFKEQLPQAGHQDLHFHFCQCHGNALIEDHTLAKKISQQIKDLIVRGEMERF